MKFIYHNFAITMMLSLLFVSQTIAAQNDSPSSAPKTDDSVELGTLTLSGNFYADNQKLPQVTLLLKENGSVVQEVLSDAGGKFEISVELDKLMTLHFEKDEFAQKIVKIDTRNIPSEIKKYPFERKGLKIDMIPLDLGVDVSVLEKPVAVLVFDPVEEGFSIDKKYERSMRPALKKLAEDVENAYESRFMESENAFEDYKLAMQDGNLFLKEGDYDNAIMQYEAAKGILPNESYPDKQIAKAQELMEANKSVEERYNSYIAAADESFKTKSWEEAKSSYIKAKDVKPNMEYPKDQLALIEQSIQAEKDYLANMALAEKQATFDAIVASADSLLALSNYQESKGKYQEALAVMPKTAYPKSKITEIDNILANQSKTEASYNSLLANANKYFTTKKYGEAKEAYTQALGIKPNEDLPKQKIAEIETLLSGLAALEAKNAELAAKKNAAIQAEYDKLILTADALMVDSKLDEAKAEYEKALVIKAKEAYPVAQIKLINGKLLEEEGLEKQFSKLMASGSKFLGAANYQRARAEYTSASNLKPEASEPKAKIAEIDAKMEQMANDAAAKQEAIDEQYENLVALADELMEEEKYTEAETAYKQALGVKVKEQYPKSQIAVIKDKLAAIAIANAASEKQAKELAAKEANYNNIVGKADAMYKAGNLTGAKAQYKNALAVMADKTYPVSQIAEIEAKEAAMAADAEAKAKADAELAAIEKQYNDAIAQADAALEAKDYTNAKLKYQDAQKVFVDRTYPGKQIEKIVALEQAAIKAELDKERLAKLAEENKVEFDALVAEGDKFVSDAQLEKGKYKYQQALKLIPGEAMATQKLRDVQEMMEEARKLAEFHAKNDTEFNRQLAIDYPNGLNETKKQGNKTTTRIVVVANNRGDEYKKEEYSYGAVFYFKNGKKIDSSTYKRETKGK